MNLQWLGRPGDAPTQRQEKASKSPANQCKSAGWKLKGTFQFRRSVNPISKAKVRRIGNLPNRPNQWSKPPISLHNGRKTTHTMNKQTKTAHHRNRITEEAHALVKATAEVAGEQVAEARRRLEEALHNVRDQAALGVETADEFIHENPYKSLGIALGVGALLGFLIARRD
jgi:ElaB/YqjD/DUF883 family membrane-anchored ribosome-binding protein